MTWEEEEGTGRVEKERTKRRRKCQQKTGEATIDSAPITPVVNSSPPLQLPCMSLFPCTITRAV